MTADWTAVVAGLGLFFAGMELLSGNLRSLTSRRFQRAVAGWTTTPWQGFLWGILAGAVTQSTSVVTFIVVGLLVARTIDVTRGLPIIVGCNLGACALLFVVSLDTGPAILLLVGLVGIAVTSERLRRWRTALWAVFGVALLFVGLDFIKTGTAPLGESALVRETLAAGAGSYLLAFAVGAGLTVLVHSSIAIAVLAMSLTASGLLSFETAAVIIAATNFGSSVTTLLMASRLRGEPLQLALFQVAFNIVGCLWFLPLVILESASDWPLILSLVERLGDAPEQRIAWAYLLFNSGVALLLLPLRKPIAKLLARLWPRTAAEDAASPAFIADFALEDPELGIALAGREHQRIYVATVALLDPLVGEASVAPAGAEPCRQLLRATAGFLEDLGRRPMSAGQYERFYGRLDDQEHLAGMLEDVARFAAVLRQLEAQEGGRHLARLLADSLHAVLHTCAEALAPETEGESLETALTLTGDRGPALRSIREAYLGERAATAEPELATAMLTGISLFERILWQVNALVARRREGGGETLPA